MKMIKRQRILSVIVFTYCITFAQQHKITDVNDIAEIFDNGESGAKGNDCEDGITGTQGLVAEPARDDSTACAGPKIADYEGYDENCLVGMDIAAISKKVYIYIMIICYMCLLNIMVGCLGGMLSPVYIYLYEISRTGATSWISKVERCTNAVQIHYIENHFVVSAQFNGTSALPSTDDSLAEVGNRNLRRTMPDQETTDFEEQTNVQSLNGGLKEPTNGESSGGESERGKNSDGVKAKALADGIIETQGPVEVPPCDDSTEVQASSAGNPQLPLHDSPHAIVYNNKPRRKMQREPDFRSTLERLQSCKSVRDALDILQQITDAKMDLVIPATREDIDLIVREFEERLRRGENPSDVDLSSEIQEELKRFLDSFILPEHKDGPKEDEISRQLSRQISEEKEKEMKIIASRLSRTFLNNTSSEENSGEGITAVKIKGGETVSETDIKFGSLVEPLDPEPTALADLVSVAPKETFKVETAAEGTTNEKEFLDLQQPKSKICIFSDREQFEHYIKSHIDPNAFSWRIIEGVAEFVVLSLHVLFGPDRIKEIQNEGGDVENLKHLDVCRQLYQNIPMVGECKCGVYCLYNRKKVGETKRALYKQGEQGDYSAAIMDRSGIEIALVKMEYEEEVSIDFADWIVDQWNKLGMGNQLVFKGNCHNYHDIPLGTKVYKMGPKTGLTEGVITKKNETYKFLNGVLLLFNQVVVQWENVPFSKPKDSGSMVFSVEKGEMISIGIVTGSKREKKLSIVTPISEIMEYISKKNRGKYYRLKQFMLKMDGRNLRKIITDKIMKRMLPRS